MTSKLCIVMFVTVVMLRHSTQLFCDVAYPELMDGEAAAECVQNVSDNNTENVDCKLDNNCTWSVEDDMKGIISITFNLLPNSCGVKEYELKLYDSTGKEWKRHLQVKNSTVNTSTKTCGKSATVRFHRVITGHYKVKINTIDMSPSKLVETKYNLNDQKPIASPSPYYISANKEVKFQISNMTQLSAEKMRIYTRTCEAIDCECNKGYKLYLWELAFNEMGHRMCRRLPGYDVATKCSLTDNENTLRCSIYNMTTGLYCFRIQLLDSSTEHSSIHTKTVNVTDEMFIAETPPVPSSSSYITVMVVLIFILTLCLLATLVFLWRRRQRYWPLSVVSREDKQTLLRQDKSQILLLYARDCKPFMTLMKSFREIMRETTGWDVYDCFDPVHMEEIALTRTDWLSRKLASSKVVLVESKCAVLHQKALRECSFLQYKYNKATDMDNLFTFGLKYLSDHCIGQTTYKKVFVVRIDGFSEKDDVLEMTPYVRYDIPKYMKKLCGDLKNLQEDQLCLSDKSMAKLSKCITNLGTHKTENPNYPSSMFDSVV